MKTARYLAPHIYTADPSVHVFNQKLYIYPSHDVDSGVPENDNGDHFDMRDYHVFSMDYVDGAVTDHGVVLDVEDVPWAERQMWDCDCAFRNGRYYLYFPAKDPCGVFRIGVATSDRPEGPFIPEARPMEGTYSIDPCVFCDDDGVHYMYFGGLWGGQLQNYRENMRMDTGHEPADEAPALPARIARLGDDMLGLAETPRAVIILDEDGNPLTAGDHERRFFEASWIHKYQGMYYFSYSTGNTQKLCYAIGDNPYGPFTFQGTVLTPVVGWTTHHSIVEFRGQWYLFYHDCVPSGGRTWLRSVKVCELHHNEDGTIRPIDGGGTREPDKGGGCESLHSSEASN
ncbi:MAG: glycoside hydrolase family 43 protein [Pontiellaceae bacterium]|nr:glycoside hydrolase family 43 protein [Pontiellaceae bacterium]MBN2784809.1 glycoside hydrolase family 43 protein [Pontiellaceae bacterium]